MKDSKHLLKLIHALLSEDKISRDLNSIHFVKAHPNREEAIKFLTEQDRNESEITRTT